MSFRFDAENCARGLTVALVAAIRQLRLEYLNEAKAHMRTAEGRDSLQFGEEEAVMGWLAVQIVGGAWAAMDNYGRGSLMDTTNRALAAYRNSDLWNPARPDLVIRGRPRGTYRDIFGRTRTTSGALEGRNLEENPPQRGRFAGEDFDPWPPSHAMETAMKWLSHGRAQKVLRDTILKFPFHQYIIPGGGD